MGDAQRMTNAGAVSGSGVVGRLFYDGSDATVLFLAEVSTDTSLTKQTASGFYSSNESTVLRMKIPITGWIE